MARDTVEKPSELGGGRFIDIVYMCNLLYKRYRGLGTRKPTQGHYDAGLLSGPGSGAAVDKGSGKRSDHGRRPGCGDEGRV